MSNQEAKRVVFYDENDQPFELIVVADLKINDTEYAILHDEDNDEDYIFKIVKHDDEEETFEIIENEEELQEVIDAYYELDGEE